MAAKGSTRTAASQGAVQAVKVKAKAKNAGPFLTAAQWNAYNKAYNAYYQQAAIRSSAAGLRKYRLQAAATLLAKYRATQSSARTAAIRAFAVSRTYRQSVLAHQNAALRSRVRANLIWANTMAGRAQFAAAGERTWAHQAIMRTLDTQQATSIEKAAYARNARARAALKPKTTATGKVTRTSSAVARGARAAGLQAASRKAPAQASKARTAAGAITRGQEMPWLTGGNEAGMPCCIATAIANHLFLFTGLALEDDQIHALHEATGPDMRIIDGLRAAASGKLRDNVILADYRPIRAHPGITGACIIGIPTRHGDHAALLLPDGKLASWGETTDITGPVEEAWALKWQITRI